jgi:hypothetical protein
MLFEVDRETALAYGIVLQMVAYLPLIVLGFLCMLWQNWSLRRASLLPRSLRRDMD